MYLCLLPSTYYHQRHLPFHFSTRSLRAHWPRRPSGLPTASFTSVRKGWRGASSRLKIIFVAGILIISIQLYIKHLSAKPHSLSFSEIANAAIRLLRHQIPPSCPTCHRREKQIAAKKMVRSDGLVSRQTHLSNASSNPIHKQPTTPVPSPARQHQLQLIAKPVLCSRLLASKNIIPAQPIPKTPPPRPARRPRK
jgi:hypothetical protein